MHPCPRQARSTGPYRYAIPPLSVYPSSVSHACFWLPFAPQVLACPSVFDQAGRLAAQGLHAHYRLEGLDCRGDWVILTSSTKTRFAMSGVKRNTICGYRYLVSVDLRKARLARHPEKDGYTQVRSQQTHPWSNFWLSRESIALVNASAIIMISNLGAVAVNLARRRPSSGIWRPPSWPSHVSPGTYI